MTGVGCGMHQIPEPGLGKLVAHSLAGCCENVCMEGKARCECCTNCSKHFHALQSGATVINDLCLTYEPSVTLALPPGSVEKYKYIPRDEAIPLLKLSDKVLVSV